MTIDEILDRYDNAKERRSVYEDTLTELGKYIWPQMQDIVHTVTNDSGEKIRTVDLYDSTAVTAASRMAVGILANLMPMGRKIFEFAAEDDRLNNDVTIKKQLAHETAAVHKVIWNSNFIGQVANLIRSLVVFTLGAVSIEKKDDKRVFKSYHIRDIFFERDYLGNVDVVYRRLFYNARQAKQAFKSDLGKSIEEALKQKDLKKSFEFVHCVYPNKDFDSNKIGSKKYSYMIINIEDKVKVDDGSYEDIKYRVVQYGENLDGDMGYGPSLEALPEVKMLQAMKKTFIVSSEKMSDPAMMVEDDGVVGQPNTSSGGLITIRSGAQYPQPWPSAANPQLTHEFINDQQQTVREMFLNDVFDALKYYRRETKAELKEAEIMQRIEEGFVVLAPVVGAIQRDLLGPLIMEIRESLIKEDYGYDVDIKIVYQGRLALAMSTFETTAIETVLAKWAALDDKYNVFDNLDMDKGFVTSAINTGIPSDMIKDPEEVQAQRQQRAEIAQAQIASELAANVAKSYKDTTTAPQPGSPAGAF